MTHRPLYLHVGLSKTGTSALQRGIFGSVPQLAEQGVGLPLTSRREHIEQVLRPLGWVTASGFTGDSRPERLRRLTQRLSRSGGTQVLVTCEDLCELDDDLIRELRDVVVAAGLEPRVVLTLRGLASVLPSEWQQFIKHRMTLDYRTFLDRVRERKGRWARHFWQRQDAIAICRRWSDAVGVDQLDVIVTPPRSRDPDGLYRLFGDVVGFEPAVLRWPDKDVNASWGYLEAELYRRLNAALGNRLQNYERAYQPAVRWPLVKGALPRGASPRTPLPPEHLPWVAEEARAQATWLRDSGVRVHGDPADLLVPASAASPLPEVDEAKVAEIAVATLANFAVHTHRQQRRRSTAGHRNPTDA